jgi:hypothetical protein
MSGRSFSKTSSTYRLWCLYIKRVCAVCTNAFHSSSLVNVLGMFDNAVFSL